MPDENQLKELRHKYHGYSIKEFKEKLNLSIEQRKLIAEQFMSIKWNFCVGNYENQSERLIILNEMKHQFGVADLINKKE